MDETEKQRAYYRANAASYDARWAYDPNDEHFVASAILSGLLNHYPISSLVDVGCGAGRALAYLQGRNSNLELSGVEPVAELRAQAALKGIAPERLFPGDACHLDFSDRSFDCVTLFGVLHHIRTPELAIREAFRVARKAVFVSDHNVYGMGSRLTKTVKQGLRDVGLRRLMALMITGGKGYHDTDWDGVFYPFSLVDHFGEFKRRSAAVYTFSTKTSAVNLYRDASHMAIFAMKSDSQN
jgi:SAM-dependent methyltransferase